MRFGQAARPIAQRTSRRRSWYKSCARFVQGHFVVGDQLFDQEGLQNWLDRNVEKAGRSHAAETRETFSPLSPREMEILQQVTRGLSNKEIAALLGISHQTVKNHMTAILNKLNVEDRTQAAVLL
jgi:DNA-binding NarL/FixJ family response regulator